jgi:hypothetical protein
MFIEINKIINKIDLEDKMITINYDQIKLRQQELQIQAEKERLIVDMLRREDNQKKHFSLRHIIQKLSSPQIRTSGAFEFDTL